jgi:hypothetical protein
VKFQLPEEIPAPFGEALRWLDRDFLTGVVDEYVALYADSETPLSSFIELRLAAGLTPWFHIRGNREKFAGEYDEFIRLTAQIVYGIFDHGTRPRV